jgi:hypothetical protein
MKTDLLAVSTSMSERLTAVFECLALKMKALRCFDTSGNIHTRNIMTFQKTLVFVRVLGREEGASTAFRNVGNYSRKT